MEDNLLLDNSENNDNLVLAETIFHYLSYWKLFAISVIVCLLAAFVFLRYSTTTYIVSSRVLINAGKNNNPAADLNIQAFSDIGIYTPPSTMENEIAVLTARSLRQAVYDSLKLGVTYIKEGKIKSKEIYKKTPIIVSISNIIKEGIFTISESDGNISITSEDGEFSSQIKLDGTQLVTPCGIMSFHENPFGQEALPITVMVGYERLPEIEVRSSKTSNVVDLSVISPVPSKAQDIVNTLVSIYNKNAIVEKNYIAKNTSDFIKERLISLFQDLEEAEKDVEAYNKSQGLIDLPSQRQILLSSSSEYDKKINDNSIQLDLLNSTKDYLMNPANEGKVIPTNLGLTDPTILTQLKEYNDEIINREKTSAKMTDDHPVKKKSNEQIAMLKNNLLNGIAMSESTLNHTLRELSRQENLYLGLSRNLTSQERESRELLRKQSIKEQLYIYLSQKLEEVGLTLVQATPNAKIIDPAMSYYSKIFFPKRLIFYLAALILGILIPILYVYVHDVFDNKIHTKDDVTKIIKAPFLGEIPAISISDPFPVLKLRSNIAERFKVVASNLEFVVGSGRSTKIILITSSTSDEGKSFFSRNLALSLATTGKKTILIDTDMRKSKLKKDLDLKVNSGLAVYLSNTTIRIDDIIDTSGTYHKNLDIIPVLVYPPNPTELLQSERMQQLLDRIKNRYEYIIIDTAPIGLVSDVYSINQYSTATIFLTRANYTLKRSLLDIKELYNDKKLNNFTCVLNASVVSKRYGYSYGEYKSNYYTED